MKPKIPSTFEKFGEPPNPLYPRRWGEDGKLIPPHIVEGAVSKPNPAYVTAPYGEDIIFIAQPPDPSLGGSDIV